MNTLILSTQNVSLRQRLVGLCWIVLPLALTFALGLWLETSRPWIRPLELDETLMPLPSLWERCKMAVFCPGMLFTAPMLVCGFALRARRVEFDTLIFCAGALFLYGLVLVARFGYLWPLTGLTVPFGVLWVLVPTSLLSGLLLLLRNERSVNRNMVLLAALLPVIPIWLWMVRHI